MKVYLDSVSTTKARSEVLDTYKELLDEYYYNSDALYDQGVAIFDIQEKSRELASKLLGFNKQELVFTAGASEANNLAIKGYCLKKGSGHIITSIYEHSSAYNAIKQLEEEFHFDVTYLNPIDGIIEIEDLKKAIRKDTILVSIMAVNNEIGAINPINELAKVTKENPGIIFHSDITQALGKIDLDLSNIDMASFSMHKIHGLKGSGVLLKKRHIELLPIISGGQQEFGLRGGTSDSCKNALVAKTLRLALNELENNKELMKEYHDYLIDRLKVIDGVNINLPKKYINELINISTRVPSEVLLNAMNEKGIMISSKSTCGSKLNEENRSLRSIDVDEDYAIRISFDYTNKKEEFDYFIDCLKEAIEKYG